MNYCIICDSQLTGFEEDICINCTHGLEKHGLDVEEEIKKLKES